MVIVVSSSLAGSNPAGGEIGVNSLSDMSVVSELSMETGVAARGVNSDSSPAFTSSCSAAGCEASGGFSSTDYSDSFCAS